MNKVVCSALALATAAIVLVSLPRRPAAGAPPDSERPHGIASRTPWTTSRLAGSPDPPPPFRVERAFPKLAFKNPLLMATMPNSDRLFVGEQAGRIYSFPNDPAAEKADLFADLAADLKGSLPAEAKGVSALYGLVFHPQFAKNRYCYVCYVLDSKKSGEELADGTRVSRFTVPDADPPRLDPKSEKVVITWLAGGHNGGDLHFGPDGFLYISTGDATSPNPPDKLDTGQDLSDLLAAILRIDVDREEKGRAYAVPADNPFVETPGARPEIWSYGFRNPWRMSFDPPTGDLWVGDVGWESWEMVYRIQRGGNYGWSVMEGRQQVRPEAKRGPTPILPPALEFSHTEAASITGGYVYRGKRLKGLAGAYVCGDWMTGRLWASRFDGDRLVSHKEIAQGPHRIVSFGLDRAGELYYLHYHETEGTIHRLVPNDDVRDTSATFPRRLSATGLFESVKDGKPAAGVIPYSVVAEQWADHATSERLLGLPGDTSARLYDTPVRVPGTAWFTARVFFPKDGVLARTFSLELTRGDPRSRRRLETQVLHFDGENWRGYSYAWNDEQTDAALVGAAGEDRKFTVTDPRAPGGRREQTWHFPGRNECLQCHNPWAGHVLGFVREQIDREHAYGPVTDNQLRALRHVGAITFAYEDVNKKERVRSPAPPLADPHDASADLDRRARSYLQANCAHCHQFGAGGTADLDLRHDVPLAQTKTLGVRPVQGTFEIPGAHILSPGDPFRSVLFYRVSKTGSGRMPHIGSEVVDERGVELMHAWVGQLSARPEEKALLDELRWLDESPALARERLEAADRLDASARALAEAAGRKDVTDEDRAKAASLQQSAAKARAEGRAKAREEVLGRLLSTTPGALRLAHALGEGRLPDEVRARALVLAAARPEPQVRDLFERYVPDAQRVKRLGSVIRPEQVLGLKGDAARGKALFFSPVLQCATCHRVNGQGHQLGPELSQVARKSSRAELLESLLEPSKKVDPQFVTYLLETDDGKVLTGLLAEKNDKLVVLKAAGDKETRVPAAKVAALVPQQKSLMPELLLRDLTAEQAADLLEFLATLK